MATGEGKTLVATLPLYLNALPGKGAHLVTVNSYLARRDSQWMGARVPVPRSHRRVPRRHRARHAASGGRPTRATSPTGRTTSSGSTTCATTWWSRSSSASSAATSSRSWTKWTRSSSTRPGRRSIISGPVGNESDAQYAEHNAAVVAAGAPADGVRQPARRRLVSGRSPKVRPARRPWRCTRRSSAGPRTSACSKLMQETGVKALVQKMELDHIADRKLPAAKQASARHRGRSAVRPR